MKKTLADYLQMKPRLTQVDLVVAEIPAVGVWMATSFTVAQLGPQYAQHGIVPDGVGAILFSAPWVLLAWPVAVALVWAAWRHDARHRQRFKAFAYVASTTIFGACLAELYAPIFKLGKALSG
jgi:hypothetical protein